MSATPRRPRAPADPPEEPQPPGGPRPLDEVQAEIVAELGALDGLRATYEHLIGLARDGPELEPAERTPERRVGGCQAEVWIRATMRNGRVRYEVASDARIVQGLALLLVRVLSDRPPRAVVDARLTFLESAGLEAQLSPTRANGLHAMVERMRSFAREHLEPDER